MRKRILSSIVIIFIVVAAIRLLYPQTFDSGKWYRVTRVIDGDTLKIRYYGKITSVRLFGIDAPERGEKGYAKATARLESLCNGKLIRLEFPSDNHRDRYNRLLAKIYLKDGSMVNEILYNEGLVVLYRKSPLF